MRAVIEALQALRGIAQVSAVTIVAEVGELSRFAKPRQLMGYSGAVASEDSSGDADPARRRSRRPAMRICGASSSKRRGPIGIDPAVGPDAAQTAGRRSAKRSKRSRGRRSIGLHARYRELTRARQDANSKRVTAVGRELLGFIWAIGVTVEARRGAKSRRRSRERRTPGMKAATVAVEGHTERRILAAPYAAGLWARPALLVRGSSRRITIMRFRPANIRVINRRDSCSRPPPMRHPPDSQGRGS